MRWRVDRDSGVLWVAVAEYGPRHIMWPGGDDARRPSQATRAHDVGVCKSERAAVGARPHRQYFI